MKYGLKIIESDHVPMWEKTDRGFETWALWDDYTCVEFYDPNEAYRELYKWANPRRILEVQEIGE